MELPFATFTEMEVRSMIRVLTACGKMGGDSAGSECDIWCGVYEQNTSVRVAEYVFTWLHKSRR